MEALVEVDRGGEPITVRGHLVRIRRRVRCDFGGEYGEIRRRSTVRIRPWVGSGRGEDEAGRSRCTPTCCKDRSESLEGQAEGVRVRVRV